MRKKKVSFRVWRKKNGISVEKFAREMDIPFSTISKFDCFPKRVPREVYRKMIAKVFPECPLAA